MSGALPEPSATDALYLIDLSNYLFRAYHALPPLTAGTGEPTHATLGTLNMLNRMFEDQLPVYLAVVMDSPGRGFRKEIDPNYKANRPPAPDDLKVQIARTREIVEGYGIPIFQQAELEADDLIGSLALAARKRGMRVVIASSDKDLTQLVDDKIVTWDAMRNKVYGPAEVEEKFGVPPSKVRDLLALVGDSSDNIPGVPGVGVKTAAKLLHEFGSVEELLARTDEIKRPKQREALRDNTEAVRRGRELIALRIDEGLELDLDALKFGDNGNEARLREIFSELQFNRFLDLLDQRHGTVEPPPQIERDYRVVLEIAELRAVVDQARAAKQLGLLAVSVAQEAMRTPLTGLALAVEPGHAVYVPIGHRYLTAPRQLSIDDVKAELGDLLADEDVAKVGHDLKFTQVVLGHHGIPVRGGRFDTMLASYLLDPEVAHKLELVAKRSANLTVRSMAELAPKQRGKPQSTAEELDVEQVGQFFCERIDSVLEVMGRQAPALDKGGLAKLLDEVELPLLDVLSQMEQTGVRVDPAPLATLGEEMALELVTLEKRAREVAGRDFNLASPKQLEAILFDELGLKSTRKTKTGRSTDAEALEAIAGDHELPQVVLEHRAIAKLKGTYVDALPKLIHPETGRIHTRWDQAMAATGRISSKDPNLQNIPIRTAHGKRIRDAFAAPDGMLMLSADYSQIELRVLAHLSHDPKLVEAFQSGQDVHVRTAMEVFGVAEADVTPTMRAQSKTVNFGVIYGMGATALSKRLSIPRTEAKRFIDAYFERYSGVRQFMEATLAEAQRTNSVRTLLGRRRQLTDLHSKNHMRRSYSERIAQNTPIQGTAADLLKLAMVKLSKPVMPGVRMVLTVHDELVFEVPKAQIEEATALTKQAMEGIYTLDVPLVVDVGSGPHWGVAH